MQLALVLGAVTALTFGGFAIALIFSDSDSKGPGIAICGTIAFIGFFFFLGGMMSSIGQYERDLQQACRDLGGETFEGKFNAATKTTPTECLQIVNNRPVNITDQAKDLVHERHQQQ